jgi:hypothetical protein
MCCGVLTAALMLTARAQEPPKPADPKDYTETPALWTCGAQDWGPWAARCVGCDDRPAAGKWSVIMNYDSAWESYFAFPKWRNANWDLSGVEYLEFKIKLPKGMTYGMSPTVYLRSQDGPFFRIRPSARESLLAKESDGEWQNIRVPLHKDPKWETFRWLDPSMKTIDFFEVALLYANSPKNGAHWVQIDDVHFGPQPVAYAPPNENAADLDVLVIERTPTYERYQLKQPNDGSDLAVCDNRDKKHYPDKGEQVTFTARVQNKGRTPLGGKFAWVLDGKEAGAGDLAVLKPREKAECVWKWAWDPGDHDLTFKVTPAGEDYCPRNNELTIRTNAIIWKHVIERGTQTEVEQKINMIGSYSFEDWLQGQVRFMNQLFAESKYDFAPNGITARVMVGKFEYVDDGYLKATCPAGPFQVGEQDITVDGGRGCTQTDTFWDNGIQSNCYLNFLNMLGRPDDCWLHEMSHQNGIIDDYQFITEPEDNKVNGVGFTYDRRGLMGGGEIWPHESSDRLYSLYAPGDVFAYNVTKGKRRGYFGEYLYCMAKDNALVINDADGHPVANAQIKVYQTEGRKIDTKPEHEGKTDAAGKFPLKNRPVKTAGVTETGCELHDNPFGPIHDVGFNGVFLVIVRPADGKEMYGFTTVQDFNLAWARGQKDKAEIPVVVKVKGDEKRWTAPPPKQAGTPTIK